MRGCCSVYRSVYYEQLCSIAKATYQLLVYASPGEGFPTGCYTPLADLEARVQGAGAYSASSLPHDVSNPTFGFAKAK